MKGARKEGREDGMTQRVYRRTAIRPDRRERGELVGDRRTALPPYRRGRGEVLGAARRTALLPYRRGRGGAEG